MTLDSGPYVLEISDQKYPPLLKEIHDPPIQLYVRGNVELLSHPHLLAVVGSRKASFYGRQAIDKIMRPLVVQGLPLVSGLAFGIDCLAHKLCVDNKQPTIAVLGSGVDDDSIYPRSHVRLAHEIIEKGGAVISEYPDGTPGYPGNFPQRNRIIAGLCRATIVVQAAQRSGSLITARLALEDGREVGAVPGSIMDPLSAGTNSLIQQGATPIINAQDVRDLLGLVEVDNAGQAHRPGLTEQQELILAQITSAPLHIDLIVQQTNLSAPIVSIALTELELMDAVEQVGGMKYIRKI